MRILKAPGHETKNAALRRVLEINLEHRPEACAPHRARALCSVPFRYPFGLNRNFVRPRLALALALRRLF